VERHLLIWILGVTSVIGINSAILVEFLMIIVDHSSRHESTSSFTESDLTHDSFYPILEFLAVTVDMSVTAFS
jgi:hypothetical protein